MFIISFRRCKVNYWHAGLLELMKIPFTGAGASGLMLCRDKGLCKQILGLHKIRIPDFLILPPGRTIHAPKGFPYPAVVKPIYEDASDGISNASIVRNEAEMLERSRFVHQRWNQLAIVEEYINGREMYVAVVGNKVRSSNDEEFLKSHLADFEFLGFIPYDTSLIEADLEGVSPFDVDSPSKARVKEMIPRL